MGCCTYHMSVFLTLCFLLIQSWNNPSQNKASDGGSQPSPTEYSRDNDADTTGAPAHAQRKIYGQKIYTKSDILKLLPEGSTYNTDIDMSIEFELHDRSSPLSSSSQSTSIPSSSIENDRKNRNRKKKKKRKKQRQRKNDNKERHKKKRWNRRLNATDGSVLDVELFDGASSENSQHGSHEHLPEEMNVEYGKLLDMDNLYLSDDDDYPEETDWCSRWINCSSRGLALRNALFRQLPACPCHLPLDLEHSEALWDKIHRRNFRWFLSSEERYQNHVYRPEATSCVRSHPSSQPDFPNVASQQCCYDNRMALITRGSGAGTPILVSPDVSKELHYDVDILPWVLCKGDWTRYHVGRPPDNSNKCKPNPKLGAYRKQVRDAQEY